jgi:hypothetical protein
VRTPSGMTTSEFSDSLKHFLDHCCVLNRRTLCWLACGSPILHVRATLWIHEATCPGYSDLEHRVWNTTIPYCPGCEEKPALRGCLDLSLPALDEAS